MQPPLRAETCTSSIHDRARPHASSRPSSPLGLRLRCGPAPLSGCGSACPTGEEDKQTREVTRGREPNGFGEAALTDKITDENESQRRAWLCLLGFACAHVNVVMGKADVEVGHTSHDAEAC